MSLKNIITFGCRLNAFESEIIKKYVEKYELDDFIFINTCAVTKESERQARQKIRHIKNNIPNAKIVVTGCMAQLFSKELEKMPEIDFLLGNEEKLLEESYRRLSIGDLPKVNISNQNSVKEINPVLITSFENRVRAFVQIQNGCSNNCSYCIITKARGNNRSIPVQQVVNQVELLSEKYIEIVLTGVNISEYGNDLSEKPNLNMLIKRILNLVPNLKYLSISSILPTGIDKELLEIIKNDKIIPHFHLSIQSGDNLILNEMNRGYYTREDCIKIAENIKLSKPDCTIGADIIVGFPGETDKQFENTLKLIYDADLDFLHIFPFSPRPGTKAFYMENKVDSIIVKERVKILHNAINEKLSNRMANYIGSDVTIVAEQDYLGKMLNYIPVSSKSYMETGKIYTKKVISVLNNMLIVE